VRVKNFENNSVMLAGSLIVIGQGNIKIEEKKSSQKNKTRREPKKKSVHLAQKMKRRVYLEN
jgi:hypothetical protein